MSLQLFRVHVRVPILLLAAIEAALFYFVPYLAASVQQVPNHDLPHAGIGWTAALFAGFCLFSQFSVGLYTTRQRSSFAGLAIRITVAMAFAVGLAALTFYLVPALQFDRRTLALTGLFALGFSLATRLLFERTVDQDMFKSRVLIYGAGRMAASVLGLRRRSDQRGFRIVGFVATSADVRVPADRVVSMPVDLLDWAVEHDVDELVVAMDDRRVGFPLHEFLECRLAGIGVLELPTFLERETGRVHLDILNPSWIIFADGFGASQLQRMLERTFDLVASASLLLLGSPLMLLAALAIKIEDGWQAPVVYRQRRVGQFNKIFDVVKFRSMQVDAEAGRGAQWAVRDDPRVTRCGAILRKTRIDELPQLWNVLRGDMSFVGPRPERPEFVDTLEQRIPYYRERHTVKPGITGWAQLCYPYGSSEKDALEKLQYDLFYVKNRSLLFDLAILLQTVEVVLWGKGAR
ncbi:MAG TPA: TIGR03013 family XrtA/PEP-CTERM system glycosyltransferase [Steroidobacteraceae bacterium]|nr:TIGR03013 family XrtA/PEP-CTERM system glycosyltransferase [Steroidobacteraceae bacterium]